MTTVAGEQTQRRAGFRHRLMIDVRPLKVAAFRRQLLGQGTAYMGSMVTAVAVPVQVYQLSHSSLAVGLVGLAGLVPLLLLGMYGGAIADSVDRRTLYLVASLGSWGVTVGLLLQTVLRVGSVPLILSLVAVQSAFFALSSASRGAIIPRLVDEHLVAAANTLTFTTTNLGQVAGPLIGGLLVVQPGGFAYAYALEAVLFAAALYAAVRLPHIPPQGPPSRAGFRAIRQGLSLNPWSKPAG